MLKIYLFVALQQSLFVGVVLTHTSTYVQGKKERIGNIFRKTIWSLLCCLKCSVKMFLRVEGMFINVLKTALGDPVAPLEYAGIRIEAELHVMGRLVLPSRPET